MNTKNTKIRNILAIESSCDETAAAIVDRNGNVLSESLASSRDLHAKTGGIIPERAARQQIKSIPSVLHAVMNRFRKETVDAIAVTVGPGLIGSLLVGVETAKTLSTVWDKPIIPINHLHGHIYSAFIGVKDIPQFPLVAMVISGGHTDIVYMKSSDELKWIGGTRDDAAGEAFDKTARLLGLTYPGGPEISKRAKSYRESHDAGVYTLFPRPMLQVNSLDMSFSGLKTAVLHYVQTNTEDSKDEEKLARICTEIETAIVDVIVEKLYLAVTNYSPKSIIVGGGVIANQYLQGRLKDRFSENLYLPKSHNTDNAAMIAMAAHYIGSPRPRDEIIAIPDLSISKFL